ncbi:MAG: TonB-dependent receptor [Gammaproteobacteria bacterium]
MRWARTKITDDVEMYAEFLYNRTTSGFQIAPLPFDARSDNTVISADNIYNPFGISFGGQATDPITEELLNPNASYRLEALGNRANKVATWQGQVLGGLRGALLDTGWNWDLSLGYSRLDQDRSYSGYPFKSSFANALGPSFLDGNGTPTCGTPGAPIAGCIPLNIFNLADPGQIGAIKAISAVYRDQYSYSMTQANLALNGPVFTMPAGDVMGAVGVEYRDQRGTFDADFLTISSPPLYKDCLLASDTCSGNQDGSYDVTEVYGEVLVPLMKDAPFARSLNLTVGLRYSDYSTFGSTTNTSFKVDWRPIDDLLVRASYADVFRAPTIIELYQAPTADAATFTDPCVGLTSAQLAANPNYALACQNVTPDSGFAQPNAQIDGLLIGGNVLGGTGLDPEEGEAWTVGFVYEPAAVRGLSLSIDYWDYSIDDIITQIDVNTTANLCVASGAPQYCSLINRFGDGTIRQIREPTVNLGTLDTSGVDFSAAYVLPQFDFGTIRVSLDATYTDKYDSTVPGNPVIKVAGTYDRQYGNIAKWRTSTQLGWKLQDWEAQLYWRYIDSIKLTDPDGAPGIQPDLNIASQSYFDLTAGYTLESTNTKFQIGINNMFDNQPPILYQNNVTNANTDVETYDTIGRYFFGSIVQKF